MEIYIKFDSSFAFNFHFQYTLYIYSQLSILPITTISSYIFFQFLKFINRKILLLNILHMFKFKI